MPGPRPGPGALNGGRSVCGMDYTHLGRSGVSVSRICLGTMNFGSFTGVPDALQIMDRALDQGINFWDTANTYGRPRAEGDTEQIIGEWLPPAPPRRRKQLPAQEGG